MKVGRLAVAAGLALAACGRTAPPPERPHLLWITIDTLRARDLEPYGYERPTAPRLAELAEEGVVVERAFAQASWTKPSVASMFTSLRPHVHGTVSGRTANHLAPGLTTIAEVLSERGWETGAFSENPHIRAEMNFDQGFAHFEGRDSWDGHRGIVDGTVQAALRWISELERERPFFCYLHVLDPHAPHQPPSELRELFVGEAPSDDVDLALGKTFAFFNYGEVKKPLEGEDFAYMKGLYDAEIRGVDRALGALFDELEALGVLEHTYVFVTSDHGESFGEHGFLHGYHVFDEALHVPAILRGPGLAPGRVEDALIEHVDLAPTLLELLGVPVPELWQGSSFVYLLESLGSSPAPRSEHREVFVDSAFRHERFRALRTEDWKLVRNEADQSWALYDLRRDPDEVRDVASEHPELVADMKARIEALLAGGPSLDLTGAEGAVDAELEEQLRALGYVDDGD